MLRLTKILCVTCLLGLTLPVQAYNSAATRVAQVLWMQGEQQSRVSHWKEAITSWQTALLVDPQFEAAALKLILAKQQLSREAASLYQAGVRYFQTLRFKEAEKVWQQALQLASFDLELQEKLRRHLEQVPHE